MCLLESGHADHFCAALVLELAHLDRMDYNLATIIQPRGRIRVYYRDARRARE